MTRLYFKIIYAIETENIITDFGNLCTEQLLQESYKTKGRTVTLMGSDDGITQAIGNRKNSFYTRIYHFFNKPENPEGDVLTDVCEEKDQKKLINKVSKGKEKYAQLGCA